jgi:hypothetical protein
MILYMKIILLTFSLICLIWFISDFYICMSYNTTILGTLLDLNKDTNYNIIGIDLLFLFISKYLMFS